MSQASEYAGACEQAERVCPHRWITQYMYADVDKQGQLSFSRRGLYTVLPPDVALDLAAYIFDVMGDPPPSHKDDLADEPPAFLAGQTERWTEAPRPYPGDDTTDEVPF